MFKRMAVPTFVTCLILAAALPLAAQTQQPKRDVETTADVPTLDGLHEVIYPLWHTAWPAKDVKMMKELLPEAEKKVDAVVKAQLPGILRDKQAKWDEGIGKLKKSLEAYQKAAAENSEQGLLDAVEKLHASFEGLVRVIYPKMEALDDYHVVLYQIYHKYLPQKDYEKLKGASEDLFKECEKLSGAEIPKRFAAKEADLKAGFKDLCAATAELRDAAKGQSKEAVDKAVEKVHTQYQKVEGLFN
jgi:hypothetical protein